MQRFLRPRGVLDVCAHHPLAHYCAVRYESETCAPVTDGEPSRAQADVDTTTAALSSSMVDAVIATIDDVADANPAKHRRRGSQRDTVRMILDRQAARPRPLSSSETDVLTYSYEVVDTVAALEAACAVLQHARVMAVDIEAFCKNDSTPQLGTVSLIQLCSDASRMVYLVDVLRLTPARVSQALQPLLTNTDITKLTFDCRRDVEALSCQLHIVPRGLVDLQLYYTALQWRQRSVSRRSSMSYVLRKLTGVCRGEEDGAVHAAMTGGHAAVWDCRPLPEDYLRYAADDVRHMYLLWHYMHDPTASSSSSAVPVSAVRALTERYVAHYATGEPVTREADPLPTEVRVGWLEECIGAGGLCAFCGAKGHVEAECFRRIHGVMRCTFCGQSGHTAAHCFRRDPQMRKCSLCGQVGHTPATCFRNNPCRHCGGNHKSDDCRRQPRRARTRLSHGPNDEAAAGSSVVTSADDTASK